jgi:hypothetical protein
MYILFTAIALTLATLLLALLAYFLSTPSSGYTTACALLPFLTSISYAPFSTLTSSYSILLFSSTPSLCLLTLNVIRSKTLF